jgi:HEAT repeat protein
MNDSEWHAISAALQGDSSPERALEAAASLQANATASDVPRLLTLLEDSSFFVREAAAWPLSDLGRVEVLPQLLETYQRGLDEGHDNDGFSAALIDLVEMNSAAAVPQLQTVVETGSAAARENATWLLTFCKSE